MKVLVLSDTHGDTDRACEIVEICKYGCDLIVHLGDTVRDSEIIKSCFPDILFVAVAGNNDFFNDTAPQEYFLDFDGVGTFICHGHKYFVKRGTDLLLCEALKNNARIALYGHTHISGKEIRNGVLLFNPGSVRQGEFGVIQTKCGKIASADIFSWDCCKGRIK